MCRSCQGTTTIACAIHKGIGIITHVKCSQAEGNLFNPILHPLTCFPKWFNLLGIVVDQTCFSILHQMNKSLRERWFRTFSALFTFILFFLFPLPHPFFLLEKRWWNSSTKKKKKEKKNLSLIKTYNNLDLIYSRQKWPKFILYF